MKSITQDMKFRYSLVKYCEKHGVSRASRKYNKSRSYMIYTDDNYYLLAYPVDKNHFKITVPVAVSDQFFGWIFDLRNYVTIVGPEDVKEKM